MSAPYAVIAGASSGALGMAAALVVVMAVTAVKRGPKRMEIVLLGMAMAVIVAHVAMGRGREDIDEVGHVAGVIAGIGMGVIVARSVTAAAAAAAAATAAATASAPPPSPAIGRLLLALRPLMRSSFRNRLLAACFYSQATLCDPPSATGY
ncbi:MAG: rhomboid family intramembrane serine protease [Gemmatimonadaceae bacterium]